MNETVYTIAELRKILQFQDDMLREEIEQFIDELEEQVEKFEEEYAE
jgi:hypothetical protein